MSQSQRMGDYWVTELLHKDPFGSLHRAVRTEGSVFGSHALVRRFAHEWEIHGVGDRLRGGVSISLRLGDDRKFGSRCRIYSGKDPWISYAYSPGQSLPALIEAAKDQGFPLTIEHALALFREVAYAVIEMHQKGLQHTLLTPFSIWVSYEGAIQVLDASFGVLLSDLLAASPRMQFRLSLYLKRAPKEPLARDLFCLGSILYELLTLEPLPMDGDLGTILQQGRLMASQEDVPFPPEIKHLLIHMLGVGRSFEDVDSFQVALEALLYEGVHDPTTFNLAFLMQTLFRERIRAENALIESERTANYAKPELSEPLKNAQASSEARVLLRKPRGSRFAAAGIAASAFAVIAFFWSQKKRHDQETLAMQTQLAAAERERNEIQMLKADLDQQARVAAVRSAELQREIANVQDSEQQSRLNKALDEEKRRQEELERKARQLVAPRTIASTLQQSSGKASMVTAEPALISVPSAPAPPPPAPVPKSQTNTLDRPPTLLSRAPLALSGWTKAVRVKLRVFVNERGEALRATLVEGAAPEVDQAAITAAMKSSYAPALRDGKASRDWVELSFQAGRE
jgi:serine/threonine protein kinase